MQTQLCEFCLKSGMLCSKCQEKVNSGEVNDQYIKVASYLLENENKYPDLQKARLNSVFEVGGYLVLVVGHGIVVVPVVAVHFERPPDLYHVVDGLGHLPAVDRLSEDGKQGAHHTDAEPTNEG